jgi:adenylyl-sulfate kinase
MGKGFCVWFSGIPSSGKSTIANIVKNKLEQDFGILSIILDGDEIRENITKGLGFSKEDRYENVTRVAWMAKQIVNAGGVALVALVSPFADARKAARKIIGEDNVYSIHVGCSTKEAINRDVKGLYAQAIKGEITGLTGYDAPYEIPTNADLDITTEYCTAEASATLVIEVLQDVYFLSPGRTALFIGRWSPFHNGHRYIIDKAINEGKNVSIGVRCSKEHFTVHDRIHMIKSVYPHAYVFAMPDIESVNIGRLVGYDVNRYDVPDNIAGISATEIRKQINCGDNTWKQNVPEEVARFLKHE